MAIAHRESNWRATAGVTVLHHPPPKSSRATFHAECVQVVDDIAAADAMVVAVTADSELRDALKEMLPATCLIFADSPEDLLARPVPVDCALLIVDFDLRRVELEKARSYVKAWSPALVNIAVGAQADGSALINLLSAGSIDRFMIKPLRIGAARNALRSAFQQHQSLRATVKAEQATRRTTSETDDAISMHCDVVDALSEAKRGQVTPERHEEIVGASCNNVARNASQQQSMSSTIGREVIDIPAAMEVVAARSTTSAPSLQKETSWTNFNSNSSWWALAMAVSITMAGLIVWGMSLRMPQSSERIEVSKVVAGHLSAAQRAVEIGSLVEPPQLNAMHFYAAALELDPDNVRARQGMNAIAERLLVDAQRFVAEGALLQAQSALDNVRRLGSTSMGSTSMGSMSAESRAELARVTALLLNAREQERASMTSAKSIEPLGVSAVGTSTHVENELPTSTQTISTREKARIDHPSDKHPPEASASPKSSDRFSSRAEESPNNSTRLSTIDAAIETAVLDPPEKTAEHELRPEPAVNRTQISSTQALLTQAASTQAYVDDPVGVAQENIAASESSSTKAASSDRQLKLIKYVPPIYPFRARAEGTEGWLDVKVTLNRDGSVSDPEIDGGALGYQFQRAAIAAVKQWRFASEPNQDAIRRITVRVHFRLQA